MSVIQLTARPASTVKEQQPMVAVVGAGLASVSPIIPILNEANNVAHLLPTSPEMADELGIVDGDSTGSAAG